MKPMTGWITRTGLAALVLAGGLVATGCEREETLGERVDDAAEEAGDELEDATD